MVPLRGPVHQRDPGVDPSARYRSTYDHDASGNIVAANRYDNNSKR
ncbi:MAG: hypothetical protein KDC01_06555 [Flavobacteriales bacterium]|nr:hypothetical protein [Flavobacteriales bacterium]